MCYELLPVTKDLLPALVSLEQSCFSDPWTEAMFSGELESPYTIYKALLLAGAPVAYMGLWCVADEGQITNIAVSPEHRRQGLATRLLEHFIILARQRGLSLLTLEVRESNTGAIGLYEKLGFQPVGRRPKYYGGKEDALLYTLFL